MRGSICRTSVRLRGGFEWGILRVSGGRRRAHCFVIRWNWPEANYYELLDPDKGKRYLIA
jgi:hypothetical protein